MSARAIAAVALVAFGLSTAVPAAAAETASDVAAVAALDCDRLSRTDIDRVLAHTRAPRLIVIFSPFRQLYRPLLDVVSDLQRSHPGRDIAVIVPELVATKWYHYLLHNQTAAIIKAYLLFSGLRRVIVVSVPWYLAD